MRRKNSRLSNELIYLVSSCHFRHDKYLKSRPLSKLMKWQQLATWFNKRAPSFRSQEDWRVSENSTWLPPFLCLCDYLNDLPSLTVAACLEECKEQIVQHGHLSTFLTHKVHGWREKTRRQTDGGGKQSRERSWIKMPARWTNAPHTSSFPSDSIIWHNVPGTKQPYQADSQTNTHKSRMKA